MNLRSVRRALKKVPPLFHTARAAQSAVRTIFGPPWLRRQIDQAVAAGIPLRIVIGSSLIYEPGWIPTNVQYLNLLVDEHWQRAFRGHPIDAMLAEHVWEHLTEADGQAGAARCCQYLRPGGRLRIAVPDGHHPDPDYVEFARPGGSGPGADYHKTFFTYQSLSAKCSPASVSTSSCSNTTTPKASFTRLRGTSRPAASIAAKAGPRLCQMAASWTTHR